MPNLTAGAWSAFAATLSAVSAFLMWRIQRRASLESARPEIVLDLWGRHTEDGSEGRLDVITFQMIRNVGSGPALHLRLFQERGRTARWLKIRFHRNRGQLLGLSRSLA